MGVVGGAAALLTAPVSLPIAAVGAAVAGTAAAATGLSGKGDEFEANRLRKEL